MKRFFAFSLLLILTMTTPVYAHCHSQIYITHRDYFQEENYFVDCDKHSVLKETSVYYYSNGTRRSYVTNTIYNANGSVLIAGCSDIRHFIYGDKHYFSLYKNKRYMIMDEFGNILTIKNYKKMQEVYPNKFLVKLNGKYGIIDITENIIVPIKYKKFELVGENLFLTKLNGYFGMLNSSNQVLIKNNYDKISPLYETFILRKQGLFGLANKNGNIIIPAECDKIKKLGEYILVKKGSVYSVYDSEGIKISTKNYTKIRLERNVLEGKYNKKWEIIKD